MGLFDWQETGALRRLKTADAPDIGCYIRRTSP
jgi:hypothetical protein